ncbi:MAG: 3-oxoacyl-ACP reductase FabG [Deltaproteobacteria bacterium]|nr:3-oxoacyl-ACP reductase FabG [Deltaproteobacteria bacterium]MBW1816885.1 3-oxoacyl-ACP reductase FabG [Deltaproteobacteria bacterium]MBW2286119.1 3-oxoacyl-ACP reductase FabG [Deltaproteobacteria bacterium]
MRLTDKVSLVTGSSRGVGAAVALAYAREGADVVVNYSSSPKAAEEVVAEIEAMGRKAIAVKADVADKSQVGAMFDQARETFGRVDILVNNAGFTRPSMLLKMEETQWDEVVDIHLKGAFLCSQAAGRMMKEQNSGKIINVTSVAGVVGTVGQVNYSAAKGGVISLTKSIARELARFKVCANVISIGILAMGMSEKITSDEKYSEVYMNRILLKRFGQPEDVTPMFVFLGSDESDYITGQLICVDGGYGMI